jgi:hypothetical protein
VEKVISWFVLPERKVRWVILSSQLPCDGRYLIQFGLRMSSIPWKKNYRLAIMLMILLALSVTLLNPAGVSHAAPVEQELTPTETEPPTITPTISDTPELTVTVTETGTFTATAGSTVTFAVTPPTPPTLTPSPGFTASPTITRTPTPTTTLEPLPELTLLFPAFSPTATATSSPEPAALAETQAVETQASRNPLPREVQWVGFLVVLLWLLLGGFLVAFIRYFTK